MNNATNLKIRCATSTPIQRQQESGKGFMTPSPTMGMTEGWNVMASVSGTQAFWNWHQAWRDVPGDMHGSASTTGTKAKAALGAIGAQECWNDWLKPIEVPEARRTGSHQGSRNYPLPVTCGLIKFQRIGTRLRWDLGEPMVSVIAIGSGVFGSYFEVIRVEVRRGILRIDLVCPGFFGWALIASLGLLSGCVDGNGARYRVVICWLMVVVEEKKPLR